MTQYNAMQKALVEAGLAENMPKQKKKNLRQITCRKCGQPMVRYKNTNIAACPKCDTSFFVMDHLN